MKHAATALSPREDWRAGGFGLYVHWPFCATKCPYCDFNSHVSSEIDQFRWTKALALQIRLWGQRLPERVLGSIFFGGGTPSLMHPDTIRAVIREAAEAWPFANDIEITLEANPSSVEATRFEAFADAGVNRISLGAQALDDRALRRLGRMHSATEAISALEIARRFFGRVSFDLIYARQDQSLAEWQAELRRALDLRPDHLSLYQLTIEDGTVFGERHKAGQLKGLPGEELGADMFDLTQEICARAGLPAYEVSNHAVPGQESRHNLVYWRGGDFVGVGPGAHGRITLGGQRRATVAPSMPQDWLAWCAGAKADFAAEEPVLPVDHAVEYLLMSLRLAEGSDTARFAALCGTPLDPVRVAELCEQNLLWHSGDRIGTTRRGRTLLNAVLRALL